MVFSIGALADGRLVFCGGLDRRVLIWNPIQPGIGYTMELGRHRDKVWSVTVLPDGRVASGGTDDRVLIWDPDQPGTPDIQLNCSVATLATANLRHIGACLVISHLRNGFSLWAHTQ
jgi:WD40 repeat protein